MFVWPPISRREHVPILATLSTLILLLLLLLSAPDTYARKLAPQQTTTEKSTATATWPGIRQKDESKDGAGQHKKRASGAGQRHEETEEQQPLQQVSGFQLESVEDLNHLAYISMRNYNITDEGLLQSSWTLSMSNALGGNHKFHQSSVASADEAVARDSLSASASSGASASMSGAQQRSKRRLALMLESFILHLRNGHLRRLNDEELDWIVASSINVTQSFAMLSEKYHRAVAAAQQKSTLAQPNVNNTLVFNETIQPPPPPPPPLNKLDRRCLQLVALYRFELADKSQKMGADSQQQGASYSRVAYEEDTNQLLSSTNQTNGTTTGGSSHGGTTSSSRGSLVGESDDLRLIELCKLAVGCQSADKLVELIAKPWLAAHIAHSPLQPEPLVPALPVESAAREREPRNEATRATQRTSAKELDADEQQVVGDGGGQRTSRKSLRDSLSLSLAKLCPLILFQLHEDDGMCSVHRDDRPPMVTVWGFATLFVTIVSFCSLIGLSITPLLGHTTTSGETTDSCGSSCGGGGGGEGNNSNSDLSGKQRRRQRQHEVMAHHYHHQLPKKPLTGGVGDSCSTKGRSSSTTFRARSSFGAASQHHLAGAAATTLSPHQQQYEHKASLTLFEGLAVGSLVGSALFSLIPQAFELQERESNQSFLLKAFIIFSGIYLFFCSERIMRIILDTRQKRKKEKQTTHRSSNSIPLQSNTGNDHRNYNYLLVTKATAVAKRSTRNCEEDGKKTGTGKSGRAQKRATRGGQGRLDYFAASQEGLCQLDLVAGDVDSPVNELQQQQQVRQRGIMMGDTSRDRRMGATSWDGATRRQLKRQLQVANAGHEKVSAREPMPSRRFCLTPATGTSAHLLCKLDDQSGATADGEGVFSTSNLPAATFSGCGGGNDNLMSTARQSLKRQRDKTRRNKARANTRQVQLPARTPKQRLQRQRNQNNRLLMRGTAGHKQQSDESDCDCHSHLRRSSSSSSTSSSSSSSSPALSMSSFSLASATAGAARLGRRRANRILGHYDSRVGGSSSDSQANLSDDRQFQSHHDHHQSDSDYNGQARAVSRQINSRQQQRSQQTAKDQLHQQQLLHDHHYRLHQQNYARELTNISNQSSSLKIASLRSGESPGTSGPQYYGQELNSRLPMGIAANSSVSERIRKQDISTVAWMIILGDGLHNFIDGISIGAAFSESILSGVSISVAVICEEFPHELGDFAVLVSSGMTVRQALGYNFLSACTCYFGMAVGIILGDVNEGASYISGLAAGVFLYIALVDMMGELSATLEETSRDSIAKTLKLLLLQNVGIFIGISIIFVLSFIDF